MSGIRRYSAEQIREMRRRGDAVVRPDAPEGPAFDDDDWEEAFPGEADVEAANDAHASRMEVALERETIQAFERASPASWREDIDRVLREHAES